MLRCSIVIPTHNRYDLLVRAVRSALVACPSDGEVLVVDDKSVVPATQVLSLVNDPRLRIVVNTGQGGAANARNLGVTSSIGKIIFFLDDDDEILPDYCVRVLSPDGPTTRAEWGFCSVQECRKNEKNHTLRRRKRLTRGIVPASSKVRDVIVAMSEGFWIDKSTLMAVGGLDPEQVIDEDTDLCIRLLAYSRQPWYETNPGMVVYSAYVPVRPEGGQLTIATPSQKGLDCYRRTYDKYAQLSETRISVQWFLATRYLRRAVKLKKIDCALTFVKNVPPVWLKLLLSAYVRTKMIIWYLKIF